MKRQATRRRRKGQLQIQFGWIFVLIVGVILLIFFFSLINSQARTSEKKININLAKHFETILTTTGQKPGTIKEYTIPRADVRFICDAQEGVWTYRINDVQARDTKYDIIFSPSQFDDDTIYTWTLDWEVPYAVATFLYVTSSRHAFIFLNSTDANSQELQAFFPANMTVITMHKSSFQITNQPVRSNNYDHYMYVFLKSEIDILLNNNFQPVEEHSTILIIDPQAGSVFDYGDLYFISAETFNTLSTPFNISSLANQPKTAYLGKASLYGALFAMEKDSYTCTMNKAFHRYKLLTLLQYHKVMDIMPDVRLYCKELLGGLAYSQGAKHILSTINLSLDQGISPNIAKVLWEKQQELDAKNKALSIEGDCPLIY